MKKRSIAILLGCLLALTLISCGNSSDSDSEIITLPDIRSQAEVSETESSSNVIVYNTKNVEEYLAFLESFDESNNEILGITTCMYTGAYTNGDFYMVTYKKLDEPRKVKATGKVSLFKTTNTEEYRGFLVNFDEVNNEILGITTCMHTGRYSNGDFYMVTYRELK